MTEGRKKTDNGDTAHPAGSCSYETILSNIPGAAYRCLPDKDWTMLFITENIKALSGYPAGDFLNNSVRSYASIIHPDDAGYVANSINAAVESGVPWEIEYRILHKDSTPRWVFEKGRASVGPEGETARLDGIILDITEHKRLEEAHMRAQARLAATLRSIDDGVISTDSAGLVIDINPAAESLTGYPASEAAGRPVQEIFRIFDTETGEPLENPVEVSLREGRAAGLSNHTLLVSRGGAERQIADSCAPIRDASGEITGAVLVFRDVSEQYRIRLKEEFEMRFQRTVADVSARFINLPPDEFDAAVDSSLAYLGRLFNVDRSYLFRFSEDLETMSNTHEWCAEGITPHKDRIQDYPVGKMAWLRDEMLKLQPVHIPDVEKLPPEAEAEKREFIAQGIRSLICLPFRRGTGGLTGFLGFDTVREARSWPENHILILQVVSEIIAGAIFRLEAYRRLKDSEERFNNLARQARTMVWEVDAGGVYTYVSPAVKEITGYSPDELVGKKRFYDLAPEEERERMKEFGLNLMKKKESLFSMENRLVGKDGSVARVLTSGMPILGAGGAPEGYRGLDVCIGGRCYR